MQCAVGRAARFFFYCTHKRGVENGNRDVKRTYRERRKKGIDYYYSELRCAAQGCDDGTGAASFKYDIMREKNEIGAGTRHSRYLCRSRVSYTVAWCTHAARVRINTNVPMVRRKQNGGKRTSGFCVFSLSIFLSLETAAKLSFCRLQDGVLTTHHPHSHTHKYTFFYYAIVVRTLEI